MARYDHLQLVRLPERLPRRKTGGGGPPPARIAGSHSQRLSQELDVAVAVQQRRRRVDAIDPALILRVQMSGPMLEEEWNRVGLTLLSSDEDRSLVLFSSSDELSEFRRKIAAFGAGPPAGQINPSFAGFIANIEAIAEVAPGDRIGMRAREAGFGEVDDFQPGTSYVIDIELWDLGRRDLRERKIDDIVLYAEAREAEEIDRHIGPSLTLVRLRCDGALVRTLLTIEEIAELDFPPEPDLVTAERIDLAIEDLPEIEPLGDDAPLIGIIDSGINDHPLIEDIIVGAIAVPDTLGTSDDHGHGTFVGGVATFGDLRGQLGTGRLLRQARLCSAKVVDHTGNFPNSRLTPRLMREAITRLSEQFACRIFVIALGDRTKVVEGGKVGPWAQTLDELVRELDIVIIVAAGNRQPRRGVRVEEAVTEYPAYLMEDTNRLCEPAGGMNIVTVGAIAHGNGLSTRAADNVGVRPITDAFEPSPFSRAGPGVRGAIKPDFIDIGGTLIYDGPTAALHGGEVRPEAGIMSLHYRPVDRLFAARSGTSHAAPLVAFKASQILSRFPGSSANLVRALLAGSASIPEEASLRLAPLGNPAELALCGHGRVDSERAAFSDDTRVVLYAEDELAVDHFAVYQIPIPEPFQTERGKRTIRVSLAYDPPVKHSRIDYNGLSMGFRLIRGCDADKVFEHYRQRAQAEGPVPDMENRFNCKLTPGPGIREKSSLQTASVTFSRDISSYGDNYLLVVRCAAGWSGDVGQQNFAVTVEISHEAEIALYERLRQRVRVRT
ncbi:peptidase S8/S53 family subtilisin-related protein (plasmid) [Rhizobium phaseoli]|uniref:S8 family peptidase n=1 Tax=Rhizobium phaseoli TaxID=396 RepID=UPI0007EBFAE0|nr:S8 family peptidase [Rhizobium phaseoli]ANL30942.1 peptidase S8/S53 family subtilisin-related protein [Rhizobium phaseoli]